MRCSSGVLALTVMATGLALSGQDTKPSARSILKLSTPEQVTFFENAAKGGFPEDQADAVTMLVINRSELFVPMLLQIVERHLALTTEDRSILTALEFIAYAGDEHSLDAVARLVGIDEKRFGRYVRRTLDDAANWRNPFEVAYKAVENQNVRVAELTVEWLESVIEAPAMRQAWAEAVLSRYGKVPPSSEWAKDPIASRLRSSKPTATEQVLRSAEVISKTR